MSEIVNKVANSGLITLNLEDFLPKNLLAFDLKPFLFMEMILKEKDYRASLKAFDWKAYTHQEVTLFCSVDAIIPHWAYMLAAIKLNDAGARVHFGTEEATSEKICIQNIESLDANEYDDKRLIIKGCGDERINTSAYVAITQKLKPVVKTLMYGEPCSTVPLYKQPKK